MHKAVLFLLELRLCHRQLHWEELFGFFLYGAGGCRDLILYHHEQKKHRSVTINLWQKDRESFIREDTHSYAHAHPLIS